jgi:hypothetical protein
LKLRIENNAIRFRISADELERLGARARVEASTRLYSEDGKTVEGEFIYALTVDPEGGPTRCRIEPSFIMLVLSPDDLAQLSASRDGVYYRRESIRPSGEVCRFLAYVEVDRPVKKTSRPESWLEH